MLEMSFSSVDRETRLLIGSIARRHEAEHFPGGCSAAVSFVFSGSISPESYILTNYGSQFTVAASSRLGLLYGLGKLLRRLGAGDLTPRKIRFKPVKPLRGIYFATHFHNWYITAQPQQLVHYVEDLTLWGMNTLAVWYDIHTFQSPEDPEAVELRDRIRLLFSCCKRLGVRTLLGMIGNEGFASSDPVLRADWRGGQNGYHAQPQGHYHVELCPSKPGGIRVILETKAAVLSQFRDTPPDMIWLWPYDQGGCTCAQCAPWGGSGFLKVLRKVVPFIRTVLPSCQILVSSWYFDLFTRGEWHRFLEHKEELTSLCDGLIAEFPFDLHFPDFLKDFPLPVYGFEELSMRGACPWGGFGANPLPRYIADLNLNLLRYQQGGFMYSEGLFEDVNKCILLSLFGDPDLPVPDILSEYAAYEFGQAGDAIVNLFYELEESLPRRLEFDGRGNPRFVIQNPEQVLESARKLDRLSIDMSQRENPRFRQIYLRTQIDRALLEHSFNSSYGLQVLYRQLVKLYNADTADWVVCPPTERSMARMPDPGSF